MSTVLVTGVSKGIGRAIAEKFLAQGWKVYGISRSDPQLPNPNFVWIGFDLMNLNDYQQIFDQIPEDLDLLVNNAGIAYMVSLKNLLPLDLEKQFAINVKAPIWLVKTMLPKLTDHGRVINISSVAAKVYLEPGLSVYSATKAAINSFTFSFAKESHIPIMAVLPGVVDTPLLHTLYGQDLDYSKYLQPADIAKVIWKLTDEGFHSGDEVGVINDYTEEESGALPKDLRVINVDRDL
jgi:NAD(P)-dependent dehydrogenase (short-subunit alcohol dehydrogenase family)